MRESPPEPSCQSTLALPTDILLHHAVWLRLGGGGGGALCAAGGFTLYHSVPFFMKMKGTETGTCGIWTDFTLSEFHGRAVPSESF